MVSEITFFETHFHDSQFGPASVETGREENQGGDDSSDDESAGKSQLTMVLQGATAFVVLFVGLWIVFSRLLSEDEKSE